LTYLDTHVAAWLYAGTVDEFSAPALREIETADLLISPAVLFELRLLEELGRIRVGPEEILTTLQHDIGLRLCSLAFHEIVRAAYQQGWTRDPFDRLIVAQAQASGANLISKDRKIRSEYSRAIW
jgi:PIN domain nuclease of toxin-antitoxin system